MPDADPILQAAVLKFAHTGFDTALRPIAAEAGVSVGLVMKRYGSKDGLRRACDDYVLAWIKQAKFDTIRAVDSERVLPALVDDRYAPILGYVINTIRAGGDSGRRFVEHMIDDARGYVADARGRGLIRPSRDEDARVRFLVTSVLGSFLVTTMLEPAEDRADMAAQYRRVREESTGPVLELFAHGLLTDRAVADIDCQPTPPNTAEKAEFRYSETSENDIDEGGR